MKYDEGELNQLPQNPLPLDHLIIDLEEDSEVK